jgi:TolB-like protein
VLDAEGLRAFVGRFRHRVVLLDFWASWSRRSLAEMRDLARLQAEIERDGFQVISCNLDEAARWTTGTVPTLRGAGANYPCVVISRGAKSAVRSWLSGEWSYDLPARFLIDRRGVVVGQWLSASSLASVEERVRRLVLRDRVAAGRAALPAGAAGLRVRVVDVRAGLGDSLAEVVADPADPARLAEQVAAQIAAKIDRSKNPRVAVLPFASSPDRQRAEPFGREAAQGVLAALRARGYYDLVGLKQTRRMIRQAGMTPLAIEFDPSKVRGRLGCDFLVIGWLRGDTGGVAGERSLAATGEEDGPGGD